MFNFLSKNRKCKDLITSVIPRAINIGFSFKRNLDSGITCWSIMLLLEPESFDLQDNDGGGGPSFKPVSRGPEMKSSSFGRFVPRRDLD